MLNFAGYWAKGENLQTDQPLNSIAPPQGVLGLSWVSADNRWDVAANGTFTASKDENDIDQTDGERFATPSWGVMDLTAGWRPSERLDLRAGIYNLTNKTYWRWLDVANMEADDPMIPLLSRPGRNFSITARISF
jgi:hemoglobin/transferrin/lactoferrin receptor protein